MRHQIWPILRHGLITDSEYAFTDCLELLTIFVKCELDPHITDGLPIEMWELYADLLEYAVFMKSDVNREKLFEIVSVL